MDDGRTQTESATGAEHRVNHDARLFANVLERLRALRRSARALLLVQRLTFLLAGVLVIGLLAGLIDYVLRWPRELRVFLWALTLGGMGVLAWRSIVTAWRFAPTLTQIALRVERMHPTLAGWLASGVDLAQASERTPLAAPVVARAADLVNRVRLSSILKREGAYRGVAALAGMMLLLSTLALWRSELMGVGARRVVTPWSKIDWPKRTGIVDATRTPVHPLGTALALRAGLIKTDRPNEQTRVTCVYRVSEHGRRIGPERSVLLTCQDRPVDAGDANSGALFERLIEPAGLIGEQATSGLAQTTSPGMGEQIPGSAEARELTLEYWFETIDDRTEPARVLLVEPPSVRSAGLKVRRPAYVLAPAAGDQAEAAADSGGSIDLGPGTDERATPPAMLAGSELTLSLNLNKPVPIPPGAQKGADGLPELLGNRAMNWARAMLGEDAAAVLGSDTKGESSTAGVAFVPAPGGSGAQVWVVRWRLDRPTRLAVKAIDEHGIESTEEAAFAFDAVRDNPPTAVITQPTEDRSVLSTAVVDVAAEGRDDVGMASLRLERQKARKPAGSAGAASEPFEDRADLAVVTTPSSAAGGGGGAGGEPARVLESRVALDLGTLDLKPGDELWLTALAADAYALDGGTHDPVRSSVRRLRIMSRQELVEQVWTELAGLRRSAIAIDQDQQKSQEQLAKPGQAGAEQAARQQSGITDRLARQEESIQRVERQLEQNQLTDEGLDRIIADSRKALRTAQSRSADAARTAGESAKAEQQAGERGGEQRRESERVAAEAREQGRQAQDDVREELANLIDLLDQGQDTWASKRAIERLIEEQKKLMERTAKTGERTSGRDPSALSASERKQLEDTAREQRAAAERAREAIDKMQQREEQMRKSDPAAAQGMSQAAQRARKEGVQDRMEEAARQIEQNQPNNAQQQQQRAVESMQQMLADMDKSAQNRDQVLRRHLASLKDSIETLVARQKDELSSLNAADESGDDRLLEALAPGMAKLHQNTLGVADEAAGGPRETASIARTLERAAQSQQSATLALRDRPINVDEARDQEESALRRLIEALEQTEKLDDQAEEREEARVLGELKKAYTQGLDRQVTIRDATQPLVGAEQNRRTRNSARLLGQDQDALQKQLADLRAKTQELKDAKVFEFAHRRLDDLMKHAAGTLNDGRADGEVLRRQAGSVKILQSIVDSLDNRKKNKDAFRDQEQGSGSSSRGGGSSAKGVPPGAELKLLRALQDEAMSLTRDLSEQAADTPARREAIAEAARLQRELSDQARSLLQRVTQEPEAGEQQPGSPKSGGEVPIEPAPSPAPDPEPKSEPAVQPSNPGSPANNEEGRS